MFESIQEQLIPQTARANPSILSLWNFTAYSDLETKGRLNRETPNKETPTSSKASVTRADAGAKQNEADLGLMEGV